MPTDEPEVAPRHLPRLAIESLLIVLSVLLGFAANQWHDRQSEKSLASQALESFRQELKENLDRVVSIQPAHAAMSDRLAAEAADASAGRRGETGFDAFRAAMPKTAGGISVPSLTDAAWETAVSTGALRLIDYQRVAQLSRTYAAQRSAVVATGQRVEDRLSDPRNFDPARRAEMLRAQSLLFRELSGQETSLIDVYRETLKELEGKGR